VTSGSQASGTWRAMGERVGELHGTIVGDRLTFTWSEECRGETWSGHGSFVYGESEIPGHGLLRGQWGLGPRSTGGAWWALKRQDLGVNAKVSLLMDGGSEDDENEQSNCVGGCDEAELPED
jgi:hypothetical protein